MSDLDYELRDVLKHYYLYMKQCEIAGDSKISHTSVKTAINDAESFNGNIISKIKQTFQENGYVYAPPTYHKVQEVLDSGALPFSGREFYDKLAKHLNTYDFTQDEKDTLLQAAFEVAEGLDHV